MPTGDRHLLYLSYADADGTAARADVCEALFRPVRGLWFLSGYVLSREGAAKLLRAMPVVGPVDMWMNFRFEELASVEQATCAIALTVETHGLLDVLIGSQEFWEREPRGWTYDPEQVVSRRGCHAHALQSESERADHARSRDRLWCRPDQRGA